MVPSSGEDEGTDAEMVTADTPSTSISLVALEVENVMLREENDKLKKQLEKHKQTFSFKFIQALREFSISLDCLMLPLSCFWKHFFLNSTYNIILIGLFK